MYNNPGKKIKNIAAVLEILLVLAFSVVGVGILYLGSLLTPITFLLAVAVAVLLSYPVYLMLYAFGELVEDVHAIRNSTVSQTEP